MYLGVKCMMPATNPQINQQKNRYTYVYVYKRSKANVAKC